MFLYLGVSVAIYAVVTWGLWIYASPDWAKGAGFAYLGSLIAEIAERLGRIDAFKRLMPEDD